MLRRNQRSLKWVAIVIYILVIVYRVNASGGGLTLYIKRRFANSHLGLRAHNDLFLVKDGKVHENKWLKTFTLPYSVNSIRMTWVSRKYNVHYSLLVSSSNPEIMLKPEISPIPTKGNVPKKDQAFQMSLHCTGSMSGVADARFVLNYTKRGESDSSTNKLEFSVSVHCNKSSEVKGTKTSQTPTKKTLNRVVVITISAVVACVVCLLVGVIFFWRFIKRIRKKFGFDEITERLSPLTEVSCHSTGVSLSSSPLPTVVYSPKRNRSPNTFFTNIVKHVNESEECLTQPTSEQTSRFCIEHGNRGVRGTFSSGGTFVRQSSQDPKRSNQGSVGDDDVFVSQRADVALIQNEETPSVASSLPALVKDKENKKEMYSTMNEYWSMKLGDSLKLRSDVDIQSEIIGEAAFGRVHKGKLTHEDTTSSINVAVKVCQEDIEFEQMVSYVNEAILMKSLAHENVLNLLGVVLQPISPPLILTPLMVHGDLHKFLRHSRGIGIRRQLIGSRRLVNFATQIARAIEYLTKQKIVHRDLAARNCFVDKDLNVKVGGLGPAREVRQFGLYKMEDPGQLAVKWLALESLLHCIFTEKTDVWSFGIVLWELVTLGSQPYAGLDNYEVAPYLEAGKRLSRPLRCPDDLFAIMYSCWLPSPEDRPSFTILVHKLEDYEERLRPSCIAFEFDEDTIEMTDDCEVY